MSASGSSKKMSNSKDDIRSLYKHGHPDVKSMSKTKSDKSFTKHKFVFHCLQLSCLGVPIGGHINNNKFKDQPRQKLFAFMQIADTKVMAY